MPRDETKDTTPPADSQPDAGHAPPASDDGTQPPESDQEPQGQDDTQDDGQHDGDGDPAVRKARREAAGLRRRLREVEAERDALRDTLTRQQQAVIDRDCGASRLSERHIAAAEINLENMLDDETGLIDTERLSQMISMAVRDFRPARPPEKNLQQGAYGPPQKQPGAEWKAAFAPRPH
jgi:hypothetical protein